MPNADSRPTPEDVAREMKGNTVARPNPTYPGRIDYFRGGECVAWDKVPEAERSP